MSINKKPVEQTLVCVHIAKLSVVRKCSLSCQGVAFLCTKCLDVLYENQVCLPPSCFLFLCWVDSYSSLRNNEWGHGRKSLVTDHDVHLLYI